MPRKQSVAIRQRRAWVYCVFDPKLETIIYVGQSISLRGRWQKHKMNTSQCALLRDHIQSKPYKMIFIVISYGGLDQGFPETRADEFEAYFMAKYKTVHHTVDNRIGCNQNNAPHVSRLEEGWYERITAELEAGYTWPEEVPVNPLDAMGDHVLAARRQEAMMADLAAKVPDSKQIEEEYSEAITACKRLDADNNSIVFAVDSPFARARELQEEYEAMAEHELVDRNVVAGQLTSIGQYSLGDVDADGEVEGMIRLWQQIVSPNKERLNGKPLTAGYASALFNVAYKWCGEHEESLLLQRHALTPEAAVGMEIPFAGFNTSPEQFERNSAVRALQWRHWTVANGGNPPKDTGRKQTERSEEAAKYGEMMNWRNGDSSRGGVARRNQSLYLLLLRHHTWFAHYVRGMSATGNSKEHQAKNVNRQLQAGFGNREMVKRGLAKHVLCARCDVCGGKHITSQALHHFLGGANHEWKSQYLVVGGELTAAKAAALGAWHDSNTDKYKKGTDEANAKANAEQRAVREASGRSRPKKQKTSATAGPSASTGAAEGSDSD